MSPVRIHSPDPNAHPLDPLSPVEIRSVVEAVRTYIETAPALSKPVERALFNSISLREPAKYAVLNWSGLFGPKDFAAAGSSTDLAVLRQADVSSTIPLSNLHCLTSGPPHLPSIRPKL